MATRNRLEPKDRRIVSLNGGYRCVRCRYSEFYLYLRHQPPFSLETYTCTDTPSMSRFNMTQITSIRDVEFSNFPHREETYLQSKLSTPKQYSTPTIHHRIQGVAELQNVHFQRLSSMHFHTVPVLLQRSLLQH